MFWCHRDQIISIAWGIKKTGGGEFEPPEPPLDPPLTPAYFAS